MAAEAAVAAKAAKEVAVVTAEVEDVEVGSGIGLIVSVLVMEEQAVMVVMAE